MTEGLLLLVDDDEVFRDVLGAALTRRGFRVATAGTAADARVAIAREAPACAVIDLRIGEDWGLDLVRHLHDTDPSIRVVVLTGFGSIATAVEAVKLGAAHYLTKPAETAEIVAALQGDAPPPDPEEARRPSVRRVEWEHIQKVLAEHDGNISATARALGMHRRTLQRKLAKYPVKR